MSTITLSPPTRRWQKSSQTATNGAHLWAERFDGLLEDVFELQDKVAISIAGVIEPTLRQSDIERARRKRPDSLDAYDLYLRALPGAFAAMRDDADKALALLGKTIELEPDFAAAHAIIAFCHEQRYLRGGMRKRRGSGSERDRARFWVHGCCGIGSAGRAASKRGRHRAGRPR